jgi:hypothetical protein
MKLRSEEGKKVGVPVQFLPSYVLTLLPSRLLFSVISVSSVARNPELFIMVAFPAPAKDNCRL